MAAIAAALLAACGGRVLGTAERPAIASGVPHPSPGGERVSPAEQARGTLVAVPRDRMLPVSREPGRDPAFAFETRNSVGQRVAMLVSGERLDEQGDGWIEVVLPFGVAGKPGWVRASAVRLVERRFRIVVDVSGRVLRLRLGGEQVLRTRVGVGESSSPTPTGTFYVWARVPQRSPSGPYGAFALGLNVYSAYFPGLRVAIHGTADPSDQGRPVSNGCVRVYNADMRELRRVPLGTPVVIRA